MVQSPSSDVWLRARIASSQNQVRRGSEMLAISRLDERLQRSMEKRFEQLLRGKEQELDQLMQCIATTDIDVTDPGKETSRAQQLERGELWDRFNRSALDAQSILTELLSVMQGALLRELDPEDKLCDVADALIEELVSETDIPWGRFTIIAPQEMLGELVGVVRVRGPESGLWSLALVGHEFGHYVGPHIRELGGPAGYSYPFVELLKSEYERNRDLRDRSYAHEYFADLFATFSIGPAYAATCILLRFDPRRANAESREHPSPAARVRAIMELLRRQEQAASADAFYLDDASRSRASFTEALEQCWQSLVQEISETDKLSQEAIGEVDRLPALIWRLLEKNLSTARYTGWATAERWARHWLDELQERRPLTIPSGRDVVGSIRDVLNAAWLCRFHAPDESGRIGDVAMRMAACLAEQDNE